MALYYEEKSVSTHDRRASRRFFRLLAILLSLAVVATACGSDGGGDSVSDAVSDAVDDAVETVTDAVDDDATDTGEDAMSDDDAMADAVVTLESVALVANQDAGDEGPVDAMIRGLDASAAEWGFDTNFVGVPDPAAHETTLRNLAESGTDLIITTFFDLGGTVEIVAPDYPDTIFLTVVSIPTAQPNVNSLAYEFFKGAYVGGRYAANMTETGRVAYIGGAPLPFAWADFNAFSAGAKDVNPDIETTATFSPGGFTDPAGGRELAASLYADGNDFIFTGAAETDLGVVEAAVENDGMVMVASDLVDRGPNNVAIVVLIEWEITIQEEIDHLIAGGETGRHRLANPESGEISFSVPDEFLAGASGERGSRAEAALSDFESSVAALIAGDLIVEEIGEEQ